MKIFLAEYIPGIAIAALLLVLANWVGA